MTKKRHVENPKSEEAREEDRMNLFLRRNPVGYLSATETNLLYAKMSADIRARVAGIYRLRNTDAVRLLHRILVDENSVENFLDRQNFFAEFLGACAELGLKPGFDRTPVVYNFEIERKKANKPDGYSRLAYGLKGELEKLSGLHVFLNFTEQEVENAFLSELKKIRSQITAVNPADDNFIMQAQKYYKIFIRLAKYRYSEMIQRMAKQLEEGQYLEVLGGLNEFYRDKIGNEIIALEENPIMRIVLETFLSVEIERLNEWFKDFDIKKRTIDQPEEETIKKEAFQLVMDRRDADSTARGVISSDCTDIRNDFAFHETIPQHLLDPGFLNMRLRQLEQWVGNVYMLVMESEHEPILVVDAIQTSEDYHFPCSTTALADGVLEQICRYAEESGFAAVYLSRFVSNRGILNHYFDNKYPLSSVKVSKIGGFKHLKDLQLWKENAFRNEYLETLMAGNPNEDEQLLPLLLVKRLK